MVSPSQPDVQKHPKVFFSVFCWISFDGLIVNNYFCWMSYFSWDKYFCFAFWGISNIIKSCEINTVSSANIAITEVSGMSRTEILYSNGPRTLSCGTLACIGLITARLAFMRIASVLLSREKNSIDSIHCGMLRLWNLYFRLRRWPVRYPRILQLCIVFGRSLFQLSPLFFLVVKLQCKHF